jgi:hypothetical protein
LLVYNLLSTGYAKILDERIPLRQIAVDWNFNKRTFVDNTTLPTHVCCMLLPTARQLSFLPCMLCS